MSDRDRILSSLRRVLAAARATVEVGTGQRSTGPPRASADNQGQLHERFIELMESQGATVRELPAPSHVPLAIARFLDSISVTGRLRMGEDPLLASIDWSTAPQLVLEKGAATFADAVSVARAIGAVASVGSCVFASGRENPASLSFLPETQVILLRAEDIVADYDGIWWRIRDLFPESPPRSLIFVAGPSRTADIGGKPVLGAHGPRNLLVLIL